MHTLFHCLTAAEREEISRLLEAGWSFTAIATLLERATSTVSREVKRGGGRGLYRALPAMRSSHMRKTLTYDQGKEMSEHKRFTMDTDMQVYFAHPGSPWERGTNENTNMLIRQYFPKGTDFRTITRQEIKRAERSLNGRPRKTLGWKKPREALHALLH